MTPAQLLALEVGFKIVEHPQEPGHYTVLSNWANSLDRYAALVAQTEREICAKLCEELQTHYPPREQLQAEICASMIRARGIQLDPKVKPLVEQFKLGEDQRAQYNQAVNDVAQACRSRIHGLRGFSGYIDNNTKIVDTPSWNAAILAAEELIREYFEQHAN
jgi:hypothetical protein